MTLRPFFTYFGAKFRAAPRYRHPLTSTIIEPFAGSAGYSLRYPNRQILLNDLNPVVAGVWDYLIHVSETEILQLPTEINSVDEFNAPIEAKHLIGFWLNKATTAPGKVPSKWTRSGIRPFSSWGAEIKARIASQLQHIRHWRITCKDYRDVGNAYATWFIDPPYEVWGKRYPVRDVNYADLAQWCLTRKGLVIVCEQQGASWLPFTSIGSIKATGNRDTHTAEVAFQKVLIDL